MTYHSAGGMIGKMLGAEFGHIYRNLPDFTRLRPKVEQLPFS
jgi:hypothetical protein